MEQVLSKLSEIESTAGYIMQEAAGSKQKMTLEMEEQCRKFDAETDAATADRVAVIRRKLETDKERELAGLKQKTDEIFKKMEDFYSQNHDKLAEELYTKILEG